MTFAQPVRRSAVPRQANPVQSIGRRSSAAAFPIAICLVLPLVQLGGLIYLYDLATVGSLWMLGFPRVRGGVAAGIRGPLLMLAAALAISAASGVIRSASLRPAIHAVQYGLALAYAYALYLNILAGRIKPALVARGVLLGAGIAAAFAMVEYALLLVNRAAGEQLYLSYLTLAGFSDRFFNERYLHAVQMTGVVRAVGTWDVATTFGGVMALSLGWIHVNSGTDRKLSPWVLGAITLAILASNSRHAWIVGFLALLPLLRSRFGTAAVGIAGALVVLTLFVGGAREAGALSLSEQVTARVQRTMTEGLEDSSFQDRYVTGTQRFVEYAAEDPSVLLAGFGINTEKALYEKMDPYQFLRMSHAHSDYGFVSNGWLLIWRNLGILGLVGLIWLFAACYRATRGAAALPLLVAGLIILSDNYAVQVARCFFLVMTFVAAATAAYASQRRDLRRG